MACGPPAQGCKQTLVAVLRRVPVPQIQEQIGMAAPAADVPVIMQLEFPQSMSYVNQEAPLIQCRTFTVQTAQQNVEIPQVQFWVGC